MKLYIKQKVFTWKDKFYIYDENQNEKYYIEGKVFSFGKKLHVFAKDGNEVAFIHEKVFSFLPKYYISRNGIDVAQVKKKFTFFRQEYNVEGLDWVVNGDFFAHEYEISKDGNILARISKKWFTWGDTYEVDISENADEIIAVCVVLVIDAVMQANNSAAISTST